MSFVCDSLTRSRIGKPFLAAVRQLFATLFASRAANPLG
jgi:hypothetical protein